MQKRPKVIAVVGPTASGKSALAVEIAAAVHGEVISADSRQMYRGLDIGSGKITKREMKGVPHHLLDVADPKTVFTVSDFTKQAAHALSDITSRGKVPIICGGTGFYIDALLLGIEVPSVKPDAKFRKTLSPYTTEKLYALLKKKDPERAQTIDQHNRVRLVRALEIVNTLGRVPTIKKKTPYDVFWVGLNPERDELQKKVHARLLARMKRGMVLEATRLHKRGLSWKRMEELGLEYRYLAQFLQKKITKKEMLLGLETKIVHYAKRQMTWFKRNKDIEWFNPEKHMEVIKRAQQFLKT